jgi:DNA gyrase subunit B
VSTNYSGDSIQILEGLEAVRVRPGMYIGSTNSRGLHHLVWEIIDNSVDEHLAGVCDDVVVTLYRDGSLSVSDNGRGIPVELQSQRGISAERVVMTVLHAGGKFNNNNYKIAGGLHGVGASVVNALSSWLTVSIDRDGFHYEDRYENGGEPVIPLENGLLPVLGTTTKSGTTVRFMPDASIFETVEFRPDIILKRMRELAFLNKGLKLTFYNEKTDETTVYHEEEGIAGLVKELNEGKDVLHDEVIVISGVSNGIEVEIAFQYSKEFNETILSYCNNINTIEGGTHITGFKVGLTRLMNQYARSQGLRKDKEENLDGRDIRNGITAVVLLRHPNPQYDGQTKTKLGNSDAKSATEEVLSSEFPGYADRHLNVIESLLEQAIKSFRMRKAEEKSRTTFLSNTSLSTNGKLAACISKDPAETEVYLVEGDSAGGSAKQGRNRQFQAILPLKGKVLNVEKQDVGKVIENKEIATLIMALGCGFGEGYGDDFNIKKLKYGKIVILTDADVDGSHIRILLLTFFHRYMPELIYEGKLFVGVPPLYKVTDGKKVQYCYSDKELQNLLKTVKHSDIQRYKGLGEMNPTQLWETTLDPATRVLKQVTIDDAYAADQITNVLMGTNVNTRREFIENNATLADLDI